MTAPLLNGSTQQQSGAARAADNESRLEAGTRRMTVAIAMNSLAFGVVMVLIGIFHPSPQPFILAAFLAISFVVSMLCRDASMLKNANSRLLLSSGLFMLVSILYAAFFAQVAVPVALLAIIISFMVASSSMEGSWADIEIATGLMSGILAALIGTNLPIQQVNLPFLLYATILMVALVFGLLLHLNIRGRLVTSLRLKIVIVALAIVILPLGILTVINTISTRDTYQKQANTALQNAAQVLATRVDEFFMTTRASIAAESQMAVFTNYMQQPGWYRSVSPEAPQLRYAMDSFINSLKIKERVFLSSLALIDTDGMVVYSTNGYEIGTYEANYDYFTEPINTGRVYYSPIEFSSQKPYVYFSALILNSNKKPAGVLRAKYDALIFQSIAKEYTEALGKNSQPLILDENYIRVAEPVNTDLLFRGIKPLSDAKVTQLLADNRLTPTSSKFWTNLPALVNGLDNHKQTPNFIAKIDQGTSTYSTTVAEVTSQPWLVVYAQDQAILVDTLNKQYRLAILTATILAGVISFAATFAARLINNPIQDLTNTALAISSGNLNVQTAIKSRDELGVLGNTFNLMAAQLQQLITSLEDRVRERTQALAHQNDALRLRATQFETVADVARGVAAAQELETLFQKVTRLISERFNFYHVGIFLLDEQAEYAVLRAANSEGGQRMLEHQHKLKVGETGIVGYATYTGTPRIATDVGQDAVFFNNPYLPLTRSEMALPLKVGDRVIGALDVQSTESNAFSEEDTQLFSILADQVAIAIYNSRLYAETAQALSEAQAVHRRYLSQEWNREIEEGRHTGYRYTNQGLLIQSDEELPRIDVNPGNGQTELRKSSDETAEESGITSLAVPIKLRGETIGMIRLQDDVSGERNWMEEEVEMVQSVAEQVALALENARLFTQTARKADRERRVLEITSKIRSTNDPQAMLQIAVEELQRTLRASRAQVVLQPRIPEPVTGPDDHGNGNGKNGNGYKHEPVE